MGYALTPTTKAPILDQDGEPILEGTTEVLIAEGFVSLSAVAGALYLVGVSNGTTDVTITRDGNAVTHPVTVSAGPFDWTLGAPVAK